VGDEEQDFEIFMCFSSNYLYHWVSSLTPVLFLYILLDSCVRVGGAEFGVSPTLTTYEASEEVEEVIAPFGWRTGCGSSKLVCCGCVKVDLLTSTEYWCALSQSAVMRKCGGDEGKAEGEVAREWRRSGRDRLFVGDRGPRSLSATTTSWSVATRHETTTE